MPLLNSLPRVPEWVAAIRGHASYSFRRHVRYLGARPAIPHERNEEPVACPSYILQ